MGETELELEPTPEPEEPPKEPEPKATELEPTPELEPLFKIRNMEEFYEVLTIAKGGNPKAIQAISEFMDFKSTAERSNFPNNVTTLCIGQLIGYGKTFYPKTDNDPFTLVGDSLSVAFMGRGGFKSNQFVDMTRDTPNLKDLQASPEQMKRGILDRFFNRSGEE